MNGNFNINSNAGGDNLYYIPDATYNSISSTSLSYNGTIPTVSIPRATTDIESLNNTPSSYLVNYPEEIVICLRGGNNKPASLTIGTSGNLANVNLNAVQGVASSCPVS